MKNKKTIGILIAGYKGYVFLKNLKDHAHINFVCSYQVKGTVDNSYQGIIDECKKRNIDFISKHNLQPERLSIPDIVVVAGWQYLLKQALNNIIILHDSLLPEYRGFSPTVAALIKGQSYLGVSAFKPEVGQFDTGPVYIQKKIPIQYPISLKTAFESIGKAYANLIMKILSNPDLKPILQDEKKATYCVWRDEKDYFIDCNCSASKIERFVNAVGWPYLGAQTNYQGQKIIINEAKAIDDINIINRTPGKIWSLNNGRPQIICGDGLLEVGLATNKNNEKVVFDKLRECLI